MKIIDTSLLDSVTEQAIESPRLRMNHNFHESMNAKSQRLLNALEPGTELPIHRHRHTAETFIILRGTLRVLFYNREREILDMMVLNPLTGKYGVDRYTGRTVAYPGSARIRNGYFRSDGWSIYADWG